MRTLARDVRHEPWIVMLHVGPPTSAGGFLGTHMVKVVSTLRRWSARVRWAVAIALLAVAYFVILPPFALARRLTQRRRGWLVRNDAATGSLERLRQPF